jgi:hypothetical protein
MREALEGFVYQMKERSRASYRHECLLYALGSLRDKPRVPEILRDEF